MASAQIMTPLGDEDLVLNLEDEDSAALKSDLTPLVGTVEKTGYQVKIRRQYEVNGLFEPHLSAEATLLVLKILPIADSIDDRITLFSALLIFEAAPDGDDDDDPPYLVSFAPAQEGNVSLGAHQTTVTKTQELKITGSAQAPVGGASLNLENSRSTEKEYTQRDLYILRTSPSREPPTLSEENAVRWEMTAATHFEGIGDSITVAVLLRRARSSRFSIRLEVKAHVGLGAEIVEKAKKLFDVRKKKKYKTLGPFGPAKGAKPVPDGQTLPEGIDPRNLHDSSVKNLLDKLAFVHKVEAVETTNFYNTAPPQARTLDTKEELKVSGTDMSGPKEQVRTVGIDLVGADPGATLAQSVVESSIKKTSTGFPIISAINGAPTTRSSLGFSNSRAMRHRKMAALYQRLAQLHREEAEEAEAFEESQYADEVEKQEALP